MAHAKALTLSALLIVCLPACVGDLDSQSNGAVGTGHSTSPRDTQKEGQTAVSSTTGPSGTTTSQGSSTSGLPAMAPGPWEKYLDPEYNPNQQLDQSKLFGTSDELSEGGITVARLRRTEFVEWMRDTGQWAERRVGQNPFEVETDHYGFSTYRQWEVMDTQKVFQLLEITDAPGYAWIYPDGDSRQSIDGNSKAWPKSLEEAPNNRRGFPADVKQDPAFACMSDTQGGEKPDAACVEAFVRMVVRNDARFPQPVGGVIELFVSYANHLLSLVPPQGYDMQRSERVLGALAAMKRSYPSYGRLSQALKDQEAVTCMTPSASRAVPTKACVSDFIAFYLREAVYFRPPSSQEIADLLEFAETFRLELPKDSYDALEHKDFIETITSAAWLSAPALFRDDLGWGAPSADGNVVSLDSWHLAHDVSKMLWKRSPGAPKYSGNGVYTLEQEGALEEIEEAAAQDLLLQPETLGQLVRTHVAYLTPRPDLPLLVQMGKEETLLADYRADLPRDFDQDSGGRRGRRGAYWLPEGVAGFFREWLEVESLHTKFKEHAWATSKHHAKRDGDPPNDLRRRGISDDYNMHLELDPAQRFTQEPSYLRQLDDMIARIVYEDKDVFGKLMNSRRFYTPADTVPLEERSGGRARPREARAHYVYGFEDSATTYAQRWKTLERRAGVLGHPAWLAAHSDNFENGTAIIYRGKWVRERLLCGFVPVVPPGVEAALGPAEGHGARERVEQSTEAAGSSCLGCHNLMNPLGKPFEVYNHAGFERVFDIWDNEQVEPNGTSTLVSMGAIPSSDSLAEGTAIQDAVDFADKLATSTWAKQCFIRQTFRYFMARPETEADAPTLSLMEARYDMSEGSFIEMLVALMSSDAFIKRLHPGVLNP